MATKKRSNTKTVVRDAGTGRFVKAKREETHPNRTIRQTVPKKRRRQEERKTSFLSSFDQIKKEDSEKQSCPEAFTILQKGALE